MCFNMFVLALFGFINLSHYWFALTAFWWRDFLRDPVLVMGGMTVHLLIHPFISCPSSIKVELFSSVHLCLIYAIHTILNAIFHCIFSLLMLFVKIN